MSDPSILVVEASVDGSPYRVLSAFVRRRLNALGVAECELEGDDGGPEPAALVGKTLRLGLARDDGGSEIRFQGMVVEAAHVGGDGLLGHLRLVAAPRLWRLSKRRDCRVFQNQTVADIVRDVLERAGIPGAEQEWLLSGAYLPRSYCVQHRETDLAFVERLLSEEGIALTVEAGEDGEKVRFSDGDFGLIEGASALTHAAEFGFDASRDFVEKLEQRVSLRSDKMVVRDYDFERPDFELRGEAQASGGSGKLETYCFPARTADDGEARRRAEVWLASMQCQRDLVVGESQALHLSPGRRFTLTGHPYAPLNCEYLLVEVEHRYRAAAWGQAEGGEHAHGCRFAAMPLSAGPWRPPRSERARRVAGYDSAVVAGPAGAEIHPDEHSRVKAQPLWDRQNDRSDRASSWMRTTQLPFGGGLLVPRMGWEVTLQHLEGDPDQPIVTGRMYTGKAPPPYALPEHKTRMAIQTATSPGGGSVNEVRFDDTKGAEEMFVNASKNMSVSAGNNATETIGGNETRDIGANQEIDVTGAKSAVSATQSWNVGGSQSVGVSTYMVDENGGAHTLSIGGSRDLTIGGDHRRLVSAASTLNVGSMQIDLVAGTVTDSTPEPMSDTIGAAFIDIAGSGRNVVCGSRVETVGGVKAVLASGGRGVEVGGSMTHDVAGAIVVVTKGDLNDNSAGSINDVAGGAQLVKAAKVTFTAKSLLTVICGGSTLTLTPGSVTLAGATVKLDGVTPQTAALIKDN